MNKCTKCGFTCAAGCQFVIVDRQQFCKKCAGTAQMEELAEIKAAQREAMQNRFASWSDLQLGESLVFDDYQANADTRHAMRRFSDCNNVAIQTQCNGSAILQKSVNPQKYGQVAIKNMARGIGDSITAMYAACGIADAGFEVFYYDVHTDWLPRASHPNVHIINAIDLPIPDNAIDLNLRYDDQCMKGICRKDWYCENFVLSKGIFEFEVKPVRPFVFSSIRLVDMRADAGKYVVISPYSNDPARNWTDENWKTVIAALGADGIKSVLIAPPDQWPQMESTFAGLPRIEFAVGKTAKKIMDLMLQAKAFIGLDSGMTHVAGLLGVASVGISTQFAPSLLWGLTDIKGFMNTVETKTIIEAVKA